MKRESLGLAVTLHVCIITRGYFVSEYSERITLPAKLGSRSEVIIQPPTL
jgi:hypothetical protein